MDVLDFVFVVRINGCPGFGFLPWEDRKKLIQQLLPDADDLLLGYADML